MSGLNFFDFKEQVSGRKAPASVAGREQEALTVTQITAKIESALRAGIPATVLVRGEASNFKMHAASGHAYFTLKDDKSCIDCVMYRGEASKLKFQPEDGMELLASGRVGVYGGRGRYQLYVNSLHPLGQGALELAFQQLRAKLEAEGLFAAERKRPIPLYPRRVAMVTSRSTAALQDMLKVLRRFPWVNLAVYHVPVQGDGSAEKIAAALADLNRLRGPLAFDVILLARGGGSLEDLWEFNEEIVARAMAASATPIITGIGHEVDVSIADLVADHHAHTPTEAAQVAMGQWRTARDLVDGVSIRVRRGIGDRVQQARQQLTAIERHEMFRRPFDRINQLRQLLDDRQRAFALATGDRLRTAHRRLHHLGERLDRRRPAHLLAQHREELSRKSHQLDAVIAARLRGERSVLNDLTMQLIALHPRHQISLTSTRLAAMEHRLTSQTTLFFQRERAHLDSLAAHLHAVNPEQVLRRGYSMTTIKKTGALVRSLEQLKPGDRIVTRLADGQIESTVEDGKQMKLFE